jgi:hypothetical protein
MHTTQQAGESTWEFLKGQVMRLGQLDGFPVPEFKPEAFRELVVALQNADSIEDARQFVDDVMMCELICPKPSQLRDMIRSARESDPKYQENTRDPFEALAAIPDNMTPTEKQNLAAHLTILQARMRETRGMTWPNRQKPTALRDALQIADKQLLRGERVTGSF